VKWLLKHPTPVVPDDREEREAAVRQSREALAESVNRSAQVDKVVSSLTRRNEINHYVRSIRATYARESARHA
jgi:hypothetical protein